MNCKNCNNEIDMCYLIENEVSIMLNNLKDKEKVKEFLDKEFDFSIDDACDTCYHTYWFEDSEKGWFYEELEKI